MDASQVHIYRLRHLNPQALDEKNLLPDAQPQISPFEFNEFLDSQSANDLSATQVHMFLKLNTLKFQLAFKRHQGSIPEDFHELKAEENKLIEILGNDVSMAHTIGLDWLMVEAVRIGGLTQNLSRYNFIRDEMLKLLQRPEMIAEAKKPENLPNLQSFVSGIPILSWRFFDYLLYLNQHEEEKEDLDRKQTNNKPSPYLQMFLDHLILSISNPDKSLSGHGLRQFLKLSSKKSLLLKIKFYEKGSGGDKLVRYNFSNKLKFYETHYEKLMKRLQTKSLWEKLTEY
jgi:hypothetical protein